MENNELIKKWLNGEITPREMAVLEKSPEYRNYKKIAESASRFKQPDFNEELQLQKLQERMKKSRPGKVRLLHLPAALKMAAILVLLLATGWFIYYHSPHSVNTGIGEISYLQLPDNSEVRLNADSKIKYFPRKWNGDRSLSLTGEAYFEVEKGSAFKVETSVGSVQVLGTSFNVKNRSGFFEVTCYEGAVMVSHAGRETILMPGEFYKVIEDNIQEGTETEGELPGWVNRESRFNAVPLKFVLAEFERQFGVTIEAKNIDREQLFTGSFSHTSRELALKAISIPLDLQYRIEANGKVILYEE